MDETSRANLTVSGVLFGFFFAAFWWILNRELTFEKEERHFKPATGVLIGKHGPACNVWHHCSSRPRRTS